MQVEIIVDRGNKVETVDVSSKFAGGMTKGMLESIREATRSAGRGEVLYARVSCTMSNEGELRRRYNDLHNEGGDGYIPDMTESSEYREWTETNEIY